MADVEPSGPRGIPTVNWVLTNLFLPLAAFATFFLAVAMTGIFVELFYSGAMADEPGAGWIPWLCALAASFGYFVACNVLIIWHRERERLRARFGG